MKVVYLIGEPGAGKSTAMRKATEHLTRAPIPNPPFGMDWLANRQGEIVAIEMGQRRPAFSGTDALGMGVMPRAVAFVKQPQDQAPVLLGEGDRLASAKFFKAVQSAGHDLAVCMIDVPGFIGAHRRQNRNSDRPQNPSWVKGRITKTHNLQAWVTHRLDGTKDRTELGDDIREIAGV